MRRNSSGGADAGDALRQERAVVREGGEYGEKDGGGDVGACEGGLLWEVKHKCWLRQAAMMAHSRAHVEPAPTNEHPCACPLIGRQSIGGPAALSETRPHC